MALTKGFFFEFTGYWVFHGNKFQKSTFHSHILIIEFSSCHWLMCHYSFGVNPKWKNFFWKNKHAMNIRMFLHVKRMERKKTKKSEREKLKHISRQWFHKISVFFLFANIVAICECIEKVNLAWISEECFSCS